MLEISAGMSYRQGVKLLNQLLHRNTESTLKFRTYRDFCERTGKQIEKSIIQKTEQTLEKYGFNAESGKVTENCTGTGKIPSCFLRLPCFIPLYAC